MEERLLVDRLRRKGQIAMPVGQRLVGSPSRPQSMFQFCREQFAAHRFAAVPLVGDGFAMMSEEPQIKSKRAVGRKRHQRAHRLDQ